MSAQDRDAAGEVGGTVRAGRGGFSRRAVLGGGLAAAASAALGSGIFTPGGNAALAAAPAPQAAQTAPTISRLFAGNLATDGRTAFSYTGYMNFEAFQDGIVSYGGWQYAVFWDQAGHANIARRELRANSWSILTLTDYTTTSTDSHNVISVGICPADGTIHLAFDMHASRLNYRVSVPGAATSPADHAWTPAVFGPVVHSITSSDSTSLTYPLFRAVPDGRLQLTIRTGSSGSGNQVLYEHAAGSGWTYLGEFIDGQHTRNAYLFGFEYQGSTLYTTWTWRESSNASTNHDIMYAYSTDYGRTWKNNAGTRVAVTGTSYITEGSPGITVWTIPENSGLINQESQAVDSTGQVHVLASRLPGNAGNQPDFNTARASAVLVHYYRDTHGTWHQIYSGFLEGTSRSQIGVDSSNNIYTVTPDYSAVAGPATKDPAYLKLRITAASAAAGWTDWAVRYTSTSGQDFGDPLLDRAYLASSDILTVYYVEYGGSRIDWQDWQVNT
jgi:hypothetical protein